MGKILESGREIIYIDEFSTNLGIQIKNLAAEKYSLANYLFITEN